MSDSLADFGKHFPDGFENAKRLRVLLAQAVLDANAPWPEAIAASVHLLTSIIDSNDEPEERARMIRTVVSLLQSSSDLANVGEMAQ
jgi:hypothetical protein